MTATPRPCAAERPDARLRRHRRRQRRSTCASRPGGSPSSSAPTPAASRPCCAALARLLPPRVRARCCSTARHIHRLPTRQVARTLGLLPQTPVAPEGITVADLVGRGRHPHHGALRPLDRTPTTTRGRRGAGRHRHPRARRPGRRRALRRPAPAGLDRDGARAGHRPAAARRADDLPRRRPPGRGARPARRPQRAPRHHDRDGAARPQPVGPLRRPPRRAARRPDRRRGQPARGRHRGGRPHTSSASTTGSIDDPVSHTPLVVPVGRRPSRAHPSTDLTTRRPDDRATARTGRPAHALRRGRGGLASSG